MLLRKLKPIFSKTLTSMKCQRSLLSYEFSQQSQKIKSFDQGNAELSLGVINIISKKPSLRQINNISLTQRILKYIKEQKDISQESKQEISSLFTTGVNIRKDREVFCQQRIRRGEIEIPDQQNDQLQTFDNNKVQENHQNLKQKDIDKKIQKSAFSQSLFVFYPTYMVTSQIFKKIVMSSNGKEILTGHMEISKSVSVFLFWKLARYIDKYRFNSQYEVPQKYFDIPKVFYWSMVTRDKKQKVIERLLKQTQKQFNQLYPENPFENIKNYYKKFTETPFLLLIIDQINQIAQAKQIVQKLQKKLDKTQDEIEQLNKQKKYIAEVKQIFKEIMPKFEGIMYLSPISIEDKVSNEFNLSRARKHQEVAQGQIQYSSLLFEDFYLQEFVNYFFFEFEQRVERQNAYKIFNDQDTKRAIKNKCLQYLRQNKGQYFLTHRNFRIIIDANKQHFYQKLKQISNEEQKINFVLENFIYIVQQSTSQYENILKEQFLKNDQNDKYRLQILFDIYKELIKINRQQKQKIKSGYYININQSDYYINYINKKNLKQSNQFLCKFLDKRIFYFFQSKSLIKLQLPLKITLRILQEEILYYVKNYVQNRSKLFQGLNKADLAKHIQRFFFKALLNGNAGLKIITPSYQTIPFEKISHEQCWFQSIPDFNKDQNKYSEKQKNQDQKKRIQQDIKGQKENNFKEQQQKKQQKNQNEGKSMQKPLSEVENKMLQQKDQLKKQQIRRIIKEDTQVRRSKNYQFLQSFTPYIKNAYLQQKSVDLLFLPANIKSKQFPKKQYFKMMQNLNKYNKCFDAVLFKYINAKDPFVQLQALDLTIGKQSDQKLKNFIKQFIGFKDRMTQKVQVKLSNNYSKQIDVRLYYYVLDNKNFEKNIQSELNQEFGEYLNFKALPKFSQYKITSLKGSKSCLLKEIGCLNYQKNIQFTNSKQENAIIFREAIRRSAKIW